MYKSMLKRLIIGMDWVNESLSNFKEEEKQEMVLGVFNAHFGEGYALQKYFFNHSFDEETSLMNAWCDEMNVHISLNERKVNSQYDNIQMVIYGLNEMKFALGRLSALIRLQPELRTVLTSKSTEEGYNPFKLYGIVNFERSLKGWRQAYLKELKTAIGKRKFESIKKSVELHFFEVSGFEDEIGWKMVHNPAIMKEEEEHIQVLNEISAINPNPEWYQKEHLTEIDMKSYEEWYCHNYLQDWINENTSQSETNVNELNDEELMHLVKEVVKHNEKQMKKANGDQNQAVGLIEFLDSETQQMIYHPFYDSTMRITVNPIEEYGRNALMDMINQYMNLKKKNNH